MDNRYYAAALFVGYVLMPLAFAAVARMNHLI